MSSEKVELKLDWCSHEAAKYKYLMPLDEEMRKQVSLLSKPYPKKSCVGSSKIEQASFQNQEGGVVPTSTLHFIEATNAT